MSARGPVHRSVRGMALINALVIVAALAGIATILLVRAHNAIDRLEGQQGADQSVLYLDAAELLVRQIVGTAETPHHHGQGWAEARRDEAIDRGHAGWQIDDLQGRFNVNWLMLRADSAGEEGWNPAAALVRLAIALEWPKPEATRLAHAAGGERRRRAAAFSGSGQRPPSQPLVIVRQLRGLPQIDDAQWQRLAPHLAALPPDTMLNVNTASLPVLAAVLPMLDQRALDAIQSRRADRPFESGDDFTLWLKDALGILLSPESRPTGEIDDENGHETEPDENGLAMSAFPLGTSSIWFEAVLTARLDSVRLQRTVVLRRHRPGAPARVHLSWHGSD